jgi:dTDP-L-rhamnose 4-epimerase
VRTLVTGGAGFIGRHVVEALTRAGHEAVVLDALTPDVHGPNPIEPSFPNGTHFIRGDVRVSDTVIRLVDTVDNVVHLAAETGVGQSMYEVSRYVDTNDRGTAVLLQAVARRRTPVRRLVLASSRAVYGEGLYLCWRCGEVAPPTIDRGSLPSWELACPTCGGEVIASATHEDFPPNPASVYAATKLQQELLCALIGRAYHTSSVTLRFFNVYGPGQSLSNPYTGILSTFYARLSTNSTVTVYEDGKMLRDFVAVQDVARAVIRAIEIDESQLTHRIFNVATGTPITILDLATLLRESMASHSEITVSGAYRVGDIRHSIADTSRAEDEIGFKASTSLETGLREWLAWAEKQDVIDSTERAEEVLRSLGLYRAARD